MERSPAQKRRRVSSACFDPWSTRVWREACWEAGLVAQRRMEQGGEEYPMSRSKGRHLEWAWPAGVSQSQWI